MKKYLTPILIILIATLLGAGLILGQKLNNLENNSAAENSQGLRLLSFKAPGMFCLGCSASIEGYLSAIGGVQSVSASLATKKVEVIYNPSIVTKDTILANQILDTYGKEFLGDEVYTGNQPQTPSTTNLPQSLALKLQDAAGLVSQLENQENYQEQFDQIDQAIARQDYQKAEELLDKLLLQL